ncbi:sulfatase-like hydrolase/transferase [Acuticoccus sp. M5D2P5]|uniref:sulfatase-like hydrolase/transferase n=1 Tax=Acuticoccus kalidii TaxID=2910977 RepID=UPI001F34BD89|nr:sulfatase-like hydrolase/transferase [Acuticoccus kalidii]
MTNVLFIMSDEHSKRVAGCYGNDVVKTPNIDRLAASGTTFDAAYTNCPICVPARASFATGRHVYEIGNWDNAFPYDGTPPGWGHRLQAAGHRTDSIGKLHYRSVEDEAGFDEEILPLHVLNGEGDVQGMIRRPPPKRPSTASLAGDAGPGESTYVAYDRKIRDAACAWLERAAADPSQKGWTCFVSFVCPHFPLVAPQEFFDLYPLDSLPMPGLRGPDDFPDHPVLRTLREVQSYEDYFRDETHVRTAIAAYYGMVSFLDDNIGRIMRTLRETGLAEDTLVVYTSDHGDNLGTRTFWGKSNMYEESAGIPLIMSGPGVPAGQRVATPVSLVDAHPTILEAVGLEPHPDDSDLPGRSLQSIIGGADPDRTVLSEYHAVASITGIFMVRFGRYKYVHYVGHRPQLFDLEADPLETQDLAVDPSSAALLAEGERRLREICDPDAVNARAFADQEARIERLGGLEKVRSAGTFPYTPAPGETPRVSG